MKLIVSPMSVPAETIAKPTPAPHAIPQTIATNSWPKSGGNEMMTRTAMGIKNAAGVSFAHLTNGVRAFTICAWNTDDRTRMVIMKAITAQMTIIEDDELRP